MSETGDLDLTNMKLSEILDTVGNVDPSKIKSQSKTICENYKAELLKFQESLSKGDEEKDKAKEIAENLEKFIMALSMFADSDHSGANPFGPEVTESILNDIIIPSLTVSMKYPTVRLHAMDLFFHLLDSFEDDCKSKNGIVFESVVDTFQQFAINPPKAQTDKKSQKSKNRVVELDENDEEIENDDDDDDDEEGANHLFELEPSTEMLLFSRICQYLLLLTNTDKKILSDGANKLWPSILKIVETVEDLPIKVEVSELIAQLLVLTLSVDYVKIWDDIHNDDDDDEEEPFSMFEEEEEEEDKEEDIEIPGFKDDEYYEGHPFYKPSLDYDQIDKLVSRLLVFDKEYPEANLGISGVVGLCCAVSKLYLEKEKSDAIFKKVLETLIQDIEKAEGPNPTVKIPQYAAVGYIVPFIPQEAVEPYFEKLYKLLEDGNQREKQWSKPAPAARGKGRGGRRGGRKGRGKGESKKDKIKKKDYEAFAKVVIQSFAQLVYKGGAHLINSAEKFLNTTAPAFPAKHSTPLYINFLIALGQTVHDNKNTSPNTEAAKKLLKENAQKWYDQIYEKAKMMFSSMEEKKLNAMHLTNLASATTKPHFVGELLFPEFLEKTLTLLLQLLEADALKIGASIVALLQRIIFVGKSTKVIQDKVKTIISSFTKYLPMDDEEEDELPFLKLAILDTLKLIVDQSELKAQVIEVASTVVPSVIETMKKSTEIALEKEKEIENAHKHDHDGECGCGHEHEHDDDEDEDEEEQKDKQESKPSAPKNTNPDEPPKFNPTFNFGTTQNTNPDEPPKFNPTFNFGTPAGGFEAGSTTTAPTFNFGTTLGGSGLNFNFGAPSVSFKFDAGNTALPTFDFGTTKEGGKGKKKAPKPVQIQDSDDEEDFDGSDDEGGFTFGDFDMDMEDDDDETEDAQTAIAAVDFLLAVLKELPESEQNKKKEATEEILSTLTKLDTLPYVDKPDLRKRKEKAEAQNK